MTTSQQTPGGGPQPPQHTSRVMWFIGAIAVLAAVGVLGFLLGRATDTAPNDAAAPISIAEITSEASQPVSPTDSPPTAVPAAAPAEPSPTVTDVATNSPPTALPTATAEPPTITPIPTEAPVIISDGVSPVEQASLDTLFAVWQLIAEQYDGAMPESQEILDAAIAGSLETLDDDYTRYVPADIAERMREDMTGSVEGIGAFVQENDDGMFEIVRPIDGQPADLAGLKAGDVIIEVDGESMDGVSFDEVILLVRGPEGTTVKLTVLREGEPDPLSFEIVRARYEVPVVEFEVLPEEIAGDARIGYVRLTEFNANADEKLRGALQELLNQDVQGIVFDMRDNLGGLLFQSIAVADAFLPDGVVLFERNIRGLDETFQTDDGDLAENIPLAVLVNGASASASEIVAGAIQDRGRAVLIGEKTFGKGSVQQIYTLSDGSELRVTVARWYTPENHTIDGEGISPDIEVESPEDLGGPEDTQLMRAVEYLLNGE